MFDEAIYELRQEKLKLDNDLKAADLRMITLYEELVLLREFETKDTALALKMEKCRGDKAGVVTAISEFQAQLATKREEIGVWQEKDKTIMNEFDTLVGEGNQFMPQLLKIFKKRIKRAKKRGNGDEDEDEDDEEDWEDDDDDDFDDEDEEMEDEDEEDSCPAGCDQTLYDKVLELREKRLDQEEIISDFQKAIDELTRSNERQQTREKQINKDLAQTEKEIESFQTEKQQRLNQLDVVITMKLDQLRCMVPRDPEDEPAGEPEILAADVGNCLVFGRKQLTQLKSRIKELELENKALRQEFKNLHKEQSRLGREKKLKDAEIAGLNAKCEDLQMLKFGQIIDLEALDKVSVSKTVDDLNEKIRVEEMKNDRQLVTMKTNHQKYRETLLRATQENTKLLENIAELSQRQFRLEKELNSTGGQMTVADQGPLIKNEVEERNRLVQLVKLQAKEVDALKAEINMLRRKGGHVYAPAVRQSTSAGENLPPN
jgi:hypothetical protein